MTEPDAVHFNWNAWDPRCERNNVRCPRCGCLHAWAADPPDWCASCGIEFRWNDREPDYQPDRGAQ
jgi:uncharacterized protein (DUF983 family)